MRIIPVMDLKDGVVVRGIGGRRHEYQPIISRLTRSCDPMDVATAFRDRFGFKELYVADLDAIAGAAPALELYAHLQELGFALLVDPGIRELKQATQLAAMGIETILIGLETIAGPAALVDMCKVLGSNRIMFSLDLMAGKPLVSAKSWVALNAWCIADQVVKAGLTRLLVLELACVGQSAGTGTQELCSHLRRSYPHLELLTGGGLRDARDLEPLRHDGVDGVLVASALHDGSLRRQDLHGL